MTTSTINTAPSEGVIDAVYAIVKEVLAECMERKDRWRFDTPVSFHVREVLSAKTPPEHRTGTAIVARVGFICGQLKGIDPLPDEAANMLRERIDALLGGGQPLRPLD